MAGPNFATLIADLQTAATGVMDDAMINRGARWIDALKVEFPSVHMMLMAVLYDTPQGVLDKLAIINRDLRAFRRNPYALEYVRQLQLKLRGNRHAPKPRALNK